MRKESWIVDAGPEVVGNTAFVGNIRIDDVDQVDVEKRTLIGPISPGTVVVGKPAFVRNLSFVIGRPGGRP